MTEFVKNEHLRNVVEFFRNKTVDTLYYGLEHEESYQILKELEGVQKIMSKDDGNASQVMGIVSLSKNNYYVLSYT